MKKTKKEYSVCYICQDEIILKNEYNQKCICCKREVHFYCGKRSRQKKHFKCIRCLDICSRTTCKTKQRGHWDWHDDLHAELTPGKNYSEEFVLNEIHKNKK